MEIKKVKKSLKLFLVHPQPVVPFLIGKPGIGKSAIVNQVAKENELEFIDLRLSQLDSCDVRGIPRVDDEKGVSKWYPPEFLPFKGIEKYEGTKGILFLDEINRARPDVLQSIFQLVYDRKVGEYELLDDWFIVAAGNMGIEDGTDVIEFDSALKNRFVYIEVEATIKDWKFWANKSGVHNSVIGFLSDKPEYLYHEIKEDEKKFLTPRTWDMFSQLLKNNDHLEPEEIVNTIGIPFLNGVSASFAKYLTNNKIPTAKDIFENYDKSKKRIKELGRDMIYQLNNELMFFIKDNINTLKKTTIKKYYKNLEKYVLDNLDKDNTVAFIEACGDINDDVSKFFYEFLETSETLNSTVFDSFFESL